MEKLDSIEELKMRTAIHENAPASKPKIAAILVTYNRCDYLKKAIDSLLNQSTRPNAFYVINNASTDNTSRYLNEAKFDSNPNFKILNLPENEGGAGGFHRGIRQAIEDGYDWLWLLDDDCVARPTALAELITVSRAPLDNIGFVCSHVIWKDGTPHEMNLPGIRLHASGQPFNKHLEHSCLLIRSCSFVSVLISKEAALNFGLPIKEMFIWGDDLEYTERITSGGMLGIYAFKSIVEHHTEKNENDDFFDAHRKTFPKHRYGIRNNLFRIKVKNGLPAFFLSLAERLFIDNIKIVLRRKDSRLAAILINTHASLASIFFRPTVEYPTTNKITK
ncbi:glycosyltransferase [Burkholderia cenocepacia]|nr:glycosyltransferase [Burkholderia cenocepacia]